MKIKIKYTDTGKFHQVSVHKLVAAAFHGISDLIVNHKDCSKLNNRPDNLEYTTVAENTRHAAANGQYSARAVEQYDLKGNFLKRYLSTTMDYTGICKCCTGNQKTSGIYVETCIIKSEPEI